jgi:hypothetical protein
MTPRTPSEIAARLARIYAAEFGGKKGQPFSLSLDEFRRLAGRQQVKQSIYQQIGEALLKNHAQLLIRADSFVAVVSTSSVLRWREVPGPTVTAECRKRIEPHADGTRSPAPTKTTLNPAAAWPFPKDDKP